MTPPRAHCLTHCSSCWNMTPGHHAPTAQTDGRTKTTRYVPRSPRTAMTARSAHVATTSHTRRDQGSRSASSPAPTTPRPQGRRRPHERHDRGPAPRAHLHPTWHHDRVRSLRRHHEVHRMWRTVDHATRRDHHAPAGSDPVNHDRHATTDAHYPGTGADALTRCADTWPRHRAKARRRATRPRRRTQ